MVGYKLDIPAMQPGEEPASAKQKGYVRALLREVGGSGLPEATLNDLGMWQASAIIDQLQAFKKQLAGDKPLNTSRIEGLNGDVRSPSRTMLWVGVVIGVAIIVILFAS